MPNADAPIHNDWNLEHPCLWREVTDAGGARLDHTSSGLSETEDLLLEFEKKGEIRYGGPPPEPGPNYEIYTRGFQVLLPTVGKQRRIIASFPLFIDNEYNSTLDYEIWTNHPEWIKSIWVDTLTNNGTLESLPILYAELELMPIKVKEVSFYNPDFEQGITLPDFWNTLSAPPGNSLFSLSDNAMSGSHSAYIKNPTDGVGAFCQTISVEEGDVIRIDGWIKVAGLQEHAFASIDVVFFGDYENPPPYPGTYPKRFSSAQGWTKVWGTYYAPPETDSAEVRCTLIGEGEVWFDDLKLLVSHGSEQGTEEINSRSPIPKLEIHPNPFMRSALISYQLPAKNRVNLEIYNASGQKIRILLDEKQSIGYHGVVWDGTDTLGKKVASGVYFCTLKAGNSIKTKKLLLLK
jgi:hypothetical protein